MGLFDKVSTLLIKGSFAVAPKIATRFTVWRFANATTPRPRRWSMAHNYTSWLGLTDRTYSGRHLDEDLTRDPDTLPDLETLKKLFLRKDKKTYYSDNTSVLFLFFAQWFTDSFLRTDFNDPKRTDSNHEIDFCALYGLSEYKTDMLRHPTERHLLDYSGSRDAPFPPKLYETENDSAIPEGKHYRFQSKYVRDDETDGWQKVHRYLHDPRKMVRVTATQSPKQIASYYAMGLEHGNGTLGYVVLNTLMLRAHNKIADQIKAAHFDEGAPRRWKHSRDIDRVFETARNAMIVILLKIVVEDYVAHISSLPLKTLIGAADKARWGKPNRIAIEFNLLYRWHSLVPDTIKVPGDEMDETEFLRNPGHVETIGVENLLTSFSKQRSGRMCLRNHPLFFDHQRDGAPSTLERTLDVVMRSSKLQSMNAYRRHFGLKPHTSFEELVGEQEDKEDLIRELKAAYGTIDNVEWFVGLLAEEHVEEKIMGQLMLTMVANDAFTQALSNPLLSANVFNQVDTFSEKGWEIINSIGTLQELADFTLGKGAATCTFNVSE